MTGGESGASIRAWRQLRIGVLRVAPVLLAAAVMVSGCGSPGSGGPVSKPTAVGGGQPTASAGAVLINGAGATFPYPLYSRWFYEYALVDPTARFNYQSIGSGGGIRQIKAGTVDFAGSDSILTDKDYRDVAPARLQMLPMVAGAVVATYNLKELDGAPPLVLDGPALAGIFLGKIKQWNDPAVAALNPGVALPNLDIIVVHRSDGSGTTAVFSEYLSAVSPEWATAVGKGTSVRWPVGLGGKGNEGVAGTVSQNPGALGYVELAFARQVGFAVARLKNAAGGTVSADSQSVTVAMNTSGSELPESLAASFVNAPGGGAWPIASYTYLVVYMDQPDCTKGRKLVAFVEWALSERGSALAGELHYVPIPDVVRRQVLARIGHMTCQGGPL